MPDIDDMWDDEEDDAIVARLVSRGNMGLLKAKAAPLADTPAQEAPMTDPIKDRLAAILKEFGRGCGNAGAAVSVARIDGLDTNPGSCDECRDAAVNAILAALDAIPQPAPVPDAFGAAFLRAHHASTGAASADCTMCRGTGVRYVSGSITYGLDGKPSGSSAATVPCGCVSAQADALAAQTRRDAKEWLAGFEAGKTFMLTSDPEKRDAILTRALILAAQTEEAANG